MAGSSEASLCICPRFSVRHPSPSTDIRLLVPVIRRFGLSMTTPVWVRFLGARIFMGPSGILISMGLVLVWPSGSPRVRGFVITRFFGRTAMLFPPIKRWSYHCFNWSSPAMSTSTSPVPGDVSAVGSRTSAKAVKAVSPAPSCPPHITAAAHRPPSSHTRAASPAVILPILFLLLFPPVSLSILFIL